MTAYNQRAQINKLAKTIKSNYISIREITNQLQIFQVLFEMKAWNKVLTLKIANLQKHRQLFA